MVKNPEESNLDELKVETVLSHRSAVVMMMMPMQSPGSGKRNLDAVRIKSALLLRDFLWRRMKLGRKSFSADNFTYFVTEVSGAGTDISVPISEFVEVGALDVLAISQVNHA